MAGKTGLGENFMGHGEGKVAFVGHGLGLEINEWPILGRGYRKPLQTGNVFAFEPKFIFPGEGAVGIELDYVVRKGVGENYRVSEKRVDCPLSVASRGKMHSWFLILPTAVP